MVFVRIKFRESKKGILTGYMYLVKSVREGKYVRQVHVAYLGPVGDVTWETEKYKAKINLGMKNVHSRLDKRHDSNLRKIQNLQKHRKTLNKQYDEHDRAIEKEPKDSDLYWTMRSERMTIMRERSAVREKVWDTQDKNSKIRRRMALLERNM